MCSVNELHTTRQPLGSALTDGSSGDDSIGDGAGNLRQPTDAGEHALRRQLFVTDKVADSVRCRQQERVADGGDAAAHDAEREPREHERVVGLRRHQQPCAVHWRER